MQPQRSEAEIHGVARATFANHEGICLLEAQGWAVIGVVVVTWIPPIRGAAADGEEVASGCQWQREPAQSIGRTHQRRVRARRRVAGGYPGGQRLPAHRNAALDAGGGAGEVGRDEGLVLGAGRLEKDGDGASKGYARPATSWPGVFHGAAHVIPRTIA